MPHVLIVDDDPTTRAALAELTTGEGLTAVTAGNLREARIQMGRLRPDVVFVELHLPDGDGMELLEQLDSSSGMEVILVTDYASAKTAVEALRRGASDYLIKPLNLQRVKAILARATDSTSAAAPPSPTVFDQPAPSSASVTVPLGVSLAEADRRLILATLEYCGGIKKRAAQLLGVSLKTLYNRLEEYRSQAPEARTPDARAPGALPPAPERSAPLRIQRR